MNRSRLVFSSLLASIRALALVAKLLLILFMARYLDYYSIGILGLFQSGVVLYTKAVGLGLFFAVNRALPTLPGIQQHTLIRDQYLTFISIYAILASLTIPITYLLEYHVFLFLAFLCIASLEHFIYECSQTLFAVQRPLAANIIFSCGTSLWVYVIIALGFAFPECRNLESVFGAWICGLTIVVIAVALSLRKWPWKDIHAVSLDRRRVLQLLRSSLPMTVATLAVVGAMFVDRYIIAESHGLATAGVYTLLWSFSNAVQTLVTTSVHVVATPKLIRMHQSGDMVSFRREVLAVVLNVAGVGLPGCLLIWLGVQVLIPYFHDAELVSQHLGTFALMLSAVMIKLFADVGYYILYATKRDNQLLRNCLTLLALSVVVNAIMIPSLGLTGAALGSVAISSAAILMHGWTAFKVINAGSASLPWRVDAEVDVGS